MIAEPHKPETWSTTLQLLQRDERRGLPIPRISQHPDGVDYNVINATDGYAMARNRCCSLCGSGMDWWIAFIGGPIAKQNRRFTTPPMHPECAENAMTLCPHIAIPHMKRANSTSHDPIDVGMDLNKPSEWFLLITRTYTHELQRTSSRGEVVPFYRAAPWKHVHRFTYEEGKLVRDGR